MSDDRFQIGLARLMEIHGSYGPAVLDRLDDIAPDLKKWIVEFAFGEVYSRPALDLKSRQIATISALVSLHHFGDELKSHIRAAIGAGCSRQEIVELVMQLALYAGFPAAISAMGSVRQAFAELDAGSTRPRG
jgi:4-carboxymuconolactone decarboxylase